MLPTLRRTYVNPFDLLREFDRGLQRCGWSGDEDGYTTAAYPVDVRETDDHIVVEAELPGFSKDDIDITLEKNTLSIQATRKTETKPEGQEHLTERRFNRVARSFTLPVPVDENKVDAKLADGVLTLTLNKREEIKPRKIAVK
ncbi:MAG: Hsp20/alpha crystallin family protein [Phycisphaeraceae bacterium]|nr:Hsp20/alpha crystallin family protein [Phycisphaeraceae bacterium]